MLELCARWSEACREVDTFAGDYIRNRRRYCCSGTADDVMNQLRQVLERAYSTVRVSFPVALTRVYGVAATIILENVRGAEKTDSRNIQKVFQPSPGRVLQKDLGLMDLIRAVLLVANSLENTLSLFFCR